MSDEAELSGQKRWSRKASVPSGVSCVVAKGVWCSPPVRGSEGVGEPLPLGVCEWTRAAWPAEPLAARSPSPASGASPQPCPDGNTRTASPESSP